MSKFTRLNILNQDRDYMQDDVVQEIANMINTSGGNRAQRKRLERALRKTENIQKHAQDHLNKRAYKEFQQCLDSNMTRFFSVLGIVLKTQYGFEESDEPDGKEEITDMFNLLNAYLVEYQELSTDEVAKICYETTGIQLIAE